MTLPQLPQDKANHSLYGSLVYLSFYLGFSIAQFSFACLLALGVVAIFGVGKEVSDFLINQRWKAEGVDKAHGVEVMDAAATLLGGAIPFVAVSIQKLFS